MRTVLPHGPRVINARVQATPVIAPAMDNAATRHTSPAGEANME
jgi:hypothetical protein